MELGSQLGPPSQKICSSIQLKSREPKVNSHPHSTPLRIPMGNHMMEHHQPRVNTTSPRVLEVTIVETHTQPTRVGVTQSLNKIVTTSIGVETMVVPIMDVITKGMDIGFATNLGCGLGGVLVKRNLRKSSRLLVQ